MGTIAASFFSLSWSFLFACDEIVFVFFCQLVVFFFLSNDFHLRALLFLRNVCDQLSYQLCLFVKCKLCAHSTCFSVSVFIRNVSNQHNKKCFLVLFFCCTCCLRVKCNRCPIFMCFRISVCFMTFSCLAANQIAEEHVTTLPIFTCFRFLSVV